VRAERATDAVPERGEKRKAHDLRAVQLSAQLRRGGPARKWTPQEAAHQAIALEHETDDTQRAIHQALVAEGGAFGPELFVVVELTRFRLRARWQRIRRALPRARG